MIQIIRCPCCGEEILIHVNGDSNDAITIFDLDDEIIRNKLNIEFGVKGGDKTSD